MESTFQEVAELWLGNIRCRVKESTYAKYANVVRKHLIPALGNCQDGELTTRQAEEMVRRELGLDLMTEEAAEKISENDRILITKSKVVTKLIRVKNNGFLEVLKNKLSEN